MATARPRLMQQQQQQAVAFSLLLASPRPIVVAKALAMCPCALRGVVTRATLPPTPGIGVPVRPLDGRRSSSFSSTARVELLGQESAFVPLRSSSLSHFFLNGHTLAPAPVELHADEATNTVSEGDSSTLFKSTMLRDVLVALLFIIGPLLGNATALAAAENSVGSSSLGLKVASFLRRSGLCDEAIVVAVASLPALELRGAIPVGYWMKLTPLKTYILAVVGNMLPVPLIALYLEKFFTSVASSSRGGKKLVDKIIANTRRKAEPIEEFKWIGLMLFVAVPFPGTGAWTGAFAASILGMSFWESLSANFVGVLLAGVLVNLVVSVGVREAILVGIALFFFSTSMWRILRFFQKNPSDT